MLPHIGRVYPRRRVRMFARICFLMVKKSNFFLQWMDVLELLQGSQGDVRRWEKEEISVHPSLQPAIWTRTLILNQGR